MFGKRMGMKISTSGSARARGVNVQIASKYKQTNSPHINRLYRRFLVKLEISHKTHKNPASKNSKIIILLAANSLVI